jgi:beta-glucanase (GH16 family)
MVRKMTLDFASNSRPVRGVLQGGNRLPVAILFAVACLTVTAAVPAFAGPPPGYKLVWGDEFDEGVGSQPNKTNWNLNATVNNPNSELEAYVTDTQHCRIVADPDATDGQALQIEATHDGDYESARIDTIGKRAFLYGYAEARIKLPYGQGIWPAFWMLGANADAVGWPACGEIDIMENIGNKSYYSKIASHLHGVSKAGGDYNLWKEYELPNGEQFHDGYHLFQMLWEPNKISFYVDGQLFETLTPSDMNGGAWPFNAPENLIINLAVGGGWPGSPDATTQFPQDMLVDYVRFYQEPDKLQPAPGQVTATAGSEGANIIVSWQGHDNVSTYNLYRATAPGAEGQTPYVAGLVNRNFIDRGLLKPIRYYYRVASVNNAGMSPLSPEVSVAPNPPDEEPFNGAPSAIPGTIRISDFDKGGLEIAYHSVDLSRAGGDYRPNDAIGMEPCKDIGGGWDVGWTAAGQWLGYTVDVATAGAYTVSFRVASGATGGTFHLEDASGDNLTGPVTVSNTGDWQTWATVAATVTLPAGRQVLRLVQDSEGYNLNTMTFANK